jgi:hypothetical protein
MAAIHIFTFDHPDARDATINLMLEFPPAGERIWRPGFRKATRR